MPLKVTGEPLFNLNSVQLYSTDEYWFFITITALRDRTASAVAFFFRPRLTLTLALQPVAFTWIAPDLIEGQVTCYFDLGTISTFATASICNISEKQLMKQKQKKMRTKKKSDIQVFMFLTQQVII